MSKFAIVSSFNVNAVSETEDRVLPKLVQLWKSLNSQDLLVRHQMGAMLIEKFGSPDKRQKPNGEAILQRYADELEIDRSDLTRMRWYAHHFKTFEVFEAKHPTVTSWTRLRELLPKLNPNSIDRTKESAKAPTTPSKAEPIRSDQVAVLPMGNQGTPDAKPQRIVKAISIAAHQLLADLNIIKPDSNERTAVEAVQAAVTRFYRDALAFLPDFRHMEPGAVVVVEAALGTSVPNEAPLSFVTPYTPFESCISGAATH
jgi:hypothetical protein